MIKVFYDENIKIKMEFDNFSQRLVNGWSTDYAVYEVMRRYKKRSNE